MHKFGFTVVVELSQEFTDAHEDSLYEAGCGDSTIGLYRGYAQIAFDREANSLSEAIGNAIRDIERSTLPGRIVRVEEVESSVTPTVATKASIQERQSRSTE